MACFHWHSQAAITSGSKGVKQKEMIFRYLAGPLIGAVIGYFTNYIAVKMLFFPRNEIKLWGHTLPFTPGAIPKGKPRLARAIGNVVGTTLITKEDLSARLQSEEVTGKICNAVMSTLSEKTKNILSQAGVTEEDFDAGKEKISAIVSTEIIKGIQGVDFTSIIVEEGGGAVKDMVRGTMLELFINDDMIRSIALPITVEFQNKLETQGMDYVQPLVKEKIDALGEKSMVELLHEMDISAETIRNTVTNVIQKMISAGVDMVLAQLNISGMVQEKIDEMSVVDLEQLVLTVMKKELNMIVNLGALIGFVLGLLNLFI